jgi:hypothetical protein
VIEPKGQMEVDLLKPAQTIDASRIDHDAWTPAHRGN